MKPSSGEFLSQQEQDHNLKIGDHLQNNLEIRDIRKGGLGIVYICYDSESTALWALKTFRKDVLARNLVTADRFKQEAKAWINLGSHPNIVKADHYFNFGNVPFLFLEYISGGDLQSKIGTTELTENPAKVILYAIDFCDGMIHAVTHGIKAHRDIKPQNCLITSHGTLKITDFGLAKVFDEDGISVSNGWQKSVKNDLRRKSKGLWGWLSRKLRTPESALAETVDFRQQTMGLTENGQCMGTITHMAPEQFVDAKYVDIRADIYSFGILLYQMIVGQLPFTARSLQECWHSHTNEPPPKIHRYPEIDDLIQTCLAKDPACRFPDFIAVRGLLAKIYTQLTNRSAPQQKKGGKSKAEELFNKALSLNELGLPAEALACYDQLLVLNPDMEEFICINKGNPLKKLGRVEEALACYDRAIKLNPNQAMTWLNKGYRLAELKRYNEALVCFDHLLTMNPPDFMVYEAWNSKGELFRHQGDLTTALICYERGIDFAPTRENCWFNKIIALQSQDKKAEAMECCDKALSVIPNSAELWTRKGMILEESARVREALSCIDRALELDPLLGKAWVLKGMFLLKYLQDSQLGLACLHQANQLGMPEAAELLRVFT